MKLLFLVIVLGICSAFAQDGKNETKKNLVSPPLTTKINASISYLPWQGRSISAYRSNTEEGMRKILGDKFLESPEGRFIARLKTAITTPEIQKIMKQLDTLTKRKSEIIFHFEKWSSSGESHVFVFVTRDGVLASNDGTVDVQHVAYFSGRGTLWDNIDISNHNEQVKEELRSLISLSNWMSF